MHNDNCPVCFGGGKREEKSYISSENKNVILDKIKYAEDASGDLIVRMYESCGTLSQTKIKFNFDVNSAYVTNMLEENEKNFHLGRYLNACGYMLTAGMVMSYIDYIIRNNMSDFRQVGFIHLHI